MSDNAHAYYPGMGIFIVTPLVIYHFKCLEYVFFWEETGFIVSDIAYGLEKDTSGLKFNDKGV